MVAERAKEKEKNKNQLQKLTAAKMQQPKKRGRKKKSCAACMKSKRRCDHTQPENEADDDGNENDGETEWMEDALAPIRQLQLPELGDGIRQRGTGKRIKKVRRALVAAPCFVPAVLCFTGC